MCVRVCGNAPFPSVTAESTSGGGGNDDGVWVAMLKEELELTQLYVTNDTRHYYAWTHRLWAVKRFSALMHAHTCGVVVQQELEWGLTFLRRHISDRSAAHYREQVFALSLAAPRTLEAAKGNDSGDGTSVWVSVHYTRSVL